jgi:hypothetical protein
MAATTMPEDISNPPLHALHDYWDGKRHGRTMPRRRDLDPLEMKTWLGRLILVDVIGDGTDFRYRIHGSVLSGRVGFDMTGRFVSSLDHAIRAATMAEYREAYRGRRAIFIPDSSFVDRPYMVFGKLVLPLSEDDSVPTMLLAGIFTALDRSRLR